MNRPARVSTVGYFAFLASPSLMGLLASQLSLRAAFTAPIGAAVTAALLIGRLGTRSDKHRETGRAPGDPGSPRRRRR